MKLIYLFSLFLLLPLLAQSQLSDLHYLPPLRQRAADLNNQAVYLSTPETTPFNVNIYQGTSTIPITVSVSNGTPYIYTLPNGQNDITMVNDVNVGIVLSTSGLRFEAPGGEKFYVNYRGRNTYQAASLTAKGRAAIGTHFKWGGVPLIRNSSIHNATLGIMATENNTTVTISDYNPDCEFRLGTDVFGLTDDTISVVLQKGQSYVVESRGAGVDANKDGWLGADIASNKGIVISNGNILVGVVATSNAQDAGIDQPVPIETLGREYVFVRGGGSDALEFPIIIATQNGTDIFVNGATSPITTINEGDYFLVPGSNYLSSTAGSNVTVTTSKNVYAYQSVAGSSSVATTGLNFIAPVNCLLPSSLDKIPQIEDIAGFDVNGALTILASTTTANTNIVVKSDGTPVTLPSPILASGLPWKSFYIPNLTGDISVESTGPIAVGVVGLSGAIGLGGYFSGFDTAPTVNLELTGGGCLPGANIDVVDASFDAYQWYGNGSIIAGATNSSYNPIVSGDYYVEVTKGSCTYDSQIISAYSCDPDIVLKKTADTNSILEGDTVIFTITVESLGVDPITNLVITDNIPAGLSIVSASPSFGSWSSPNWIIGTMNSGELHSITFETIATELPFNSTTNSFTNTVSNSQDQVDGNITADDLTEIISIENNEITVTKVALPAPDGSYDEMGEVITYQLIVTNNGDNTLTNVRISDPLSDSGGTTPSSIPSLAPNATTTFTVLHTINTSDFNAYQVINTATAYADLSNGFTISDTSDDPNDTTNYDSNSDGEPDDTTIVILHNPKTVITNRRITFRVKKN